MGLLRGDDMLDIHVVVVKKDPPGMRGEDGSIRPVLENREQCRPVVIVEVAVIFDPAAGEFAGDVEAPPALPGFGGPERDRQHR